MSGETEDSKPTAPPPPDYEEHSLTDWGLWEMLEEALHGDHNGTDKLG